MPVPLQGAAECRCKVAGCLMCVYGLSSLEPACWQMPMAVCALEIGCWCRFRVPLPDLHGDAHKYFLLSGVFSNSMITQAQVAQVLSLRTFLECESFYLEFLLLRQHLREALRVQLPRWRAKINSLWVPVNCSNSAVGSLVLVGDRFRCDA